MNTDIEVFFSPHGSCRERIVQLINAAKISILVQAYTFTGIEICTSLSAKAGIVTFIGDNAGMSGNGCLINNLILAKAKCYIDRKHAIAHNKIMIIDSEIVITGSYNFTKAAENSNAENIVIIHDKKIAQQFNENFQMHLGHSFEINVLITQATSEAEVVETELSQE